MNTKTLVRYYDRLDGDERFRLSLEAYARDDERELRRLRDACPIKMYSAMDREYARRWNGSITLINRFATMWLGSLMRYDVARLNLAWARDALDTFDQGYISGANAAWREAEQEGTYLALEDIRGDLRRDDKKRRLFGPLEAHCEQRAAELKGVHVGFVQFCGRAGLDPETLLIWFTPIRDQFALLRPLLDGDTPHSEEAAAGTDEVLSASWPFLRTE